MSSLGERIKKARENLGLSQAELANLIEIKPSSGVISNWERDLNKPDAEKIIRICDVLHISLSYLLDYYGNSDFETTFTEQDHIKKYRALDGYGKKVIDHILTDEYNRVKEQSMQVEEESTPYLYTKTEYLTDLSAGTGLFVFDDIPTQTTEVPAKYKDADFVVGVSGDSMEPTYTNGDRVAVKKQCSIEQGEVGVFMIEGNGYIKELGNNVLISHNKKYSDIIISDNTLCIGKVLGKI